LKINNDIRMQVISDIKTTLALTSLEPIKKYFNGHPGSLSESELPAISVGISDGEDKSDLSTEKWESALTVRIYVKGVLDVDSELDVYSEEIRALFDSEYVVNGLVETCNRGAFSYQRDEVMPWGILDLIYIIEYEG